MKRMMTVVLCLMVGLVFMISAPASAQVEHATDGLGDVLIFPYYTVNDGWNTLFNITNTSGSTVAVKVRFREALESVDVYDFNLVLSPYDVFTGWVAMGENGPEFHTNDNSCTVPSVGGANAAFVTSALPAGEEIRANEGYVELIMMGSTEEMPVGSVAYNAKHGADGEPRNCDLVDAAFTLANIGDTQDEFGPNINALKGMFTLVNKAQGIAAGGEPLTMSNFSVEGAGACLGWCPGENLITAQEPPAFSFPDLADGDDGLAALEEAIAVVALGNSWSANPVNGVKTDWVITQPTKHFNVPWTRETYLAAEAAGVIQRWVFGPYTAGWIWQWAGEVPWSAGPCTGLKNALFEDLAPVVGASPVTLYDREEQTTTSGTVISPRPGTPFDLCPEVNVLTFSDDSESTGALASNILQVMDTTKLGKNGWAGIPLNGRIGLPATAFAFWARDFGDPTMSYGNLVDHAYVRPGGDDADQ